VRVVLTAIHPSPSPQAVPLANAFLKAYLATDKELSATVSVTLCDFFLDRSAPECATAILAENPAAVGFSLYVWNRDLCLEVAAVLRRSKPGLTLFAGGPEATAAAEGILANSPLDFIITGEGEVTFLEAMKGVMNGASLAGTKGIATCSTGSFINLPRKPVESLDLLPSPYLGGFLDLSEPCGVLWQLSRGCDFACDFCFDHQGGRGVRRFSLERLAEELKFFARHMVPQVFVLDSTFNHDVKRAKQILRLIKKIAPHIHFHFEVRSEFIDKEMARLFAQITCSLQVGLQSADPQVQRRVGRIFNPADFEEKIGFLNDAGAVFGFDLIYGLPGDSLEGFAASLDYALRLYPNHLDIFPLAVLPGTRLFARADDYGLVSLKVPPYTLLCSPTFTEAEMSVATGLANACNIFYSRGRAVAWFNAILIPLKCRSAAFIERFRLWLAEKGGEELAEERLADARIWQMQRDFLKDMFAEKKLLKLLPVALDLVDYHYYYAAALLAPVPELPTDRELEGMNLLDQPLELSSSARLAQFHYEVFDILESGEIDLKEFTACFTASGSSAVIYPRGDEIFSESLIEPYYHLLKALNGTTSAGDICRRIGLPADEAASFLEFAAAEGIVVPAVKSHGMSIPPGSSEASAR
jgi:radical SAM superfamily enzyme YgiQ (UPF0313 family)